MNLTDGLTEHLQDVTPPPPDLDRVVGRGRRLRRTRLTVQAAAAVLAVGALGGTALLLRDGGGGVVTEPPPLSTGAMDLSHGLRAYGDPGRVVVLGGRTVSAQDLGEDGWLYLDTDAVATPKGVVYFRAGKPWLLTAKGTSRSLWDGEVDDPKGWHPTAKADAVSGEVAFAVVKDGAVTLAVRDLGSTGTVSLPVACAGESGCDKLVIDGIDSGNVFVRTSRGTFVWSYAAGKGGDKLEPFAGTRTRVADVRNKTVLYDGPRPTVTLQGWTYVAGAIDAQLTFDGRNILDWSSVLKSVANGEAIILRLPEDAQFFTVDTDGSILAATAADPTHFFDCEVPSGECERIGELQVTGGDPQFIGNDM